MSTPAMVAQPEANWIERYGPVCPVSADTLVEVMYYDGTLSYEPIAAKYYDWSGSGDQHSPFTAYRVVRA